MIRLFIQWFGDGGLPPRRDDPFAVPEIAGMTPAQLADLPLPHPRPDSSAERALRRATLRRHLQGA